jgi:hypothetical protein
MATFVSWSHWHSSQSQRWPHTSHHPTIMNGITSPLSSSLLSLNTFKEDEKWVDFPDIDTPFDEMGDYKHQIIVQHLSFFQRHDGDHLEYIIDQCVWTPKHHLLLLATSFMMRIKLNWEDLAYPYCTSRPTCVYPKVSFKHDPDYKQFRPFFGWLVPAIITNTFEYTTQYACYLLVPCSRKHLIDPIWLSKFIITTKMLLVTSLFRCPSCLN